MWGRRPQTRREKLGKQRGKHRLTGQAGALQQKQEQLWWPCLYFIIMAKTSRRTRSSPGSLVNMEQGKHRLIYTRAQQMQTDRLKPQNPKDRKKDCEGSQREGQSVPTWDKSKKHIRLRQKSHERQKRASEYLSDQRIRVLSPGQLSFRRKPGLGAGYTGALLRPAC